MEASSQYMKTMSEEKKRLREELFDVSEQIPKIFANSSVKPDSVDTYGFRHYKGLCLRELLSPTPLEDCTILQVMAYKGKHLRLNSKKHEKTIHCLSGKYNITSGGQVQKCSSGSVFTIPPGANYELNFQEDTLLIVSIKPKIS